jgi:WD40 repeat protein
MRHFLLLPILALLAACGDTAVTPPDDAKSSRVVVMTELLGPRVGEEGIVTINLDSTGRSVVDSAILVAQPVAGRILWNDRRSLGLVVSNLDGSGRTVVAEPYGFRVGEFASLASDGRAAAWNDGGLYVREISAGASSRIAEMSDHGGPLFSPDGRRIVFKNSLALQVVDRDGTGAMTLADTVYSNDDAPAWSPDGREIAIGTSSGVLIVDVSTRARRVLMPDTTVHGVGWSRDGRRIAVAIHRRPEEIRILDAVTGASRATLAVGTDDAQWLRWSPDDRSLLYIAAGAYGIGPVRVIDIATGSIRTLAASALTAYWRD